MPGKELAEKPGMITEILKVSEEKYHKEIRKMFMEI
jgi:hypothetical protein